MYMKKLLLIGIIVLCSSFLFAQGPDWVKGGHSQGFEYVNAVTTDASGNIYVTGQIEYTTTFDGGGTYTVLGGHDVFIAKYSAAGDVNWVQSFGGPDGDIGWAIDLDALGNVYVTGEFEDSMTVGSTKLVAPGAEDGNDIFLVKYNNSGQLQWAKQAGGPWHDKAFGLTVDALGNIYMGGFFSGEANFGGTMIYGYGVTDAVLAKYDTDGNIIWVKKSGGTGDDEIKAIAIDNSGNIYISGGFEGTANFGGISKSSAGGIDAFIAKYDNNGTIIWAKTGGGSLNDKSRGITVDASGNVYATGEVEGSSSFDGVSATGLGWFDIFVAKYNNNGDLQWYKTAGGNNKDAGRAITNDAAGMVYVTGEYSNTGTFGSFTINPYGQIDMFTAKYDASGEVLGVVKAGGGSDDAGKGIAIDPSSNIIVGGYYWETADFIFGGMTQTSAGMSDLFVAKYPQIATSVRNLEFEKGISVYPNPASDHLMIRNNPENMVKAVMLTNYLGQIVLKENMNSNQVEHSLNIEGLKTGIYVLELQLDNEVIHQNIVIQ